MIVVAVLPASQGRDNEDYTRGTGFFWYWPNNPYAQRKGGTLEVLGGRR